MIHSLILFRRYQVTTMCRHLTKPEGTEDKRHSLREVCVCGVCVCGGGGVCELI